ncbi:MAG: N-6 DNA methylase, partial [Halobacteriovoraceae bacterium]|nr:N-6 DNA methylase [Halobacteriovoraceae bacterium]
NAYKAFKERLIKECNVHTIVSLPAGVFLPYSAVKTSVIFFDKTQETKDIWFYEVPLLEGKKLTKKNGITEKHFSELEKIYKTCKNTLQSWLVPVGKVLENDTNLSAAHYNPHGIEAEELLEPNEYAQQIKDLLQSSLKNIDELIVEMKGVEKEDMEFSKKNMLHPKKHEKRDHLNILG